MALPTFHNVRFPEDISYGSSGGPGFNTTVIELSSGAEQRNINWSQARANYDVSHGVKTREQMEDLLDFFYARRGKAYGFRFKDWMDYEFDRQGIGYTDAQGKFTLQTYKRYEPLSGYNFDRKLTRLVNHTGRVWVGGEELTAEQVASTINYDTGIVSVQHTVWNLAPNALVELSCEFDVPVRFDVDDMKITHDDWEQMSWPSIPLVELKGA